MGASDGFIVHPPEVIPSTCPDGSLVHPPEQAAGPRVGEVEAGEGAVAVWEESAL